MNVNFLSKKALGCVLLAPSIVISSYAEVGEIWPAREAERAMFVEDFDNDGDLDVLLSQPFTEFGNAGGGFKLFLFGAEDYEEVGIIFAHPKTVALEHHWKQSRIWAYQKGGGWVGMLGYYELENGRLTDFQGIEINSGDAGTKMGNQLIDVIMNSDHSITPKKVVSGPLPEDWKHLVFNPSAEVSLIHVN